MFTDSPQRSKEQLAVFALLNLGFVSSLASGTLRATEAVHLFYRAENCNFVRKRLRDKTADGIMSHGVQLPDVFTVLPPEEAQREFQRELEAMRGLCLKLLQPKRLAA